MQGLLRHSEAGIAAVTDFYVRVTNALVAPCSSVRNKSFYDASLSLVVLEFDQGKPCCFAVDEEMKLTGDSLSNYTSSSMPSASPPNKPAEERTNAPLPEAYMADFNF